ncbi:MAG: DUF4147 domain-containing protein [Proteobacteria bacterium]|nr:DUF4147 domain-containing protein [Pseudomonadota bacterium]
MLSSPPAALRALYATAVARAQPAHGLAAQLLPPPAGRTWVVGAGKASAAMALALEAAWPADAPLAGLVIAPHGPLPPGAGQGRIAIRQGAHPVPDAAGAAATQALLAQTAAQRLTADDRVIALISGGGSALLSAPAPGFSLADKQALNTTLLRSGAPIAQMNVVRKHLSAVKGGRLALACAPAPVCTLLVSDVPGDAPEAIASGPTLPDPSTVADAAAVLTGLGLAVPAALSETPKPGDPVFAGHRVHVLARAADALAASAELARTWGATVRVLGDALEGEARELGRAHAALALAQRTPVLLLSGGETTVTLRGGETGGHGGRNTEYLLALALALGGAPHIWALAADTDGIDGHASGAGAVITPTTLARARALGLDAADHLARHDAHRLFAALGDLLPGAPTFTNVNDFRAIWVGPQRGGV